MNHIYRVIWNGALGVWQVVGEASRSRGKGKSRRAATVLASLLGMAAAGALAADLPQGGQVVAGQGSISQTAQTLTVNQSTARMAVDWQSFSVGQGKSVNFVQPGASSVALNRVLGSDVSVIQGAINANGQIFLLNPNGVLFTPTAQVNVGALMASTLNMSTQDFMAGKYTLSGNSANAVVNQGQITAVGDAGKGGVIALLAARVINEGSAVADGGAVLMGAGSMVTLDLGGPVKLQVEQGVLDALVKNQGAIRADGGQVFLTARAVDSLTRATVNNTGVIRAQTLTTGEKGEIRLIADMVSGDAVMGGTLDASAPVAGNGGFIETSGATVQVQSDLQVNAGAAQGRGGEWLIDPYNYTINSTAATTIVNSLNTGTNVTVSTAVNTGPGAGSSGNGDITVSSAIAKTAGGDATLTLRADQNIFVNANITSTSNKLGVTLSAANGSTAFGGVDVADNIQIKSNGGNILIGGAGGNITAAQALANGIGYALNADATSEAVNIGLNAQILSGGGNITINGYSTQPISGGKTPIGVHVGGGATIDSGLYASGASVAGSGGYININGKFVGGTGTNSDKVFGVQIDNPTGNSGQTTLSASTTTGGIRISGSSTWDAGGSYALNMATNGLAGNIYFNAYSVADLIFLINGSLQGVTFTYQPPSSGCRSGYPNCGLLHINSSANNSYLYATYNAVNMSVLPIYVSATLTGTKVYDGSTAATGLNFSDVVILDPNGSGYASSNVTSASYVTPNANVGSYSNLYGNTLNRNHVANSNNYVVGYNFNVSPNYTITPATASLSAVKTYDGNGNFTGTQITAGGVAGQTLSLSGTGPATAQSPNVSDNSTNFLTDLGGLVLANGAGASAGMASNYQLPSLLARSVNNTAYINPANLTVANVSGARYYNGTAVFSSTDLSTGVSGLGLTGSATVASANAGVYNSWVSSSLVLTGTDAPNYTLVGGNVAATINKAPLGLAVLGVYNGTTTLTTSGGALSKTNAVFHTAGLVGSESINEVQVANANVPGNGSNSVVTAFGANGFDINNYQLGNSQNMSGSVAFDGTQTTPTTSTNAVWLRPAPLGVVVSGSYNGTTTFTTAGGATITGYGLVGQDATGAQLTSATLDKANVNDASNYVKTVAGTGTFNAANYVLDGSYLALSGSGTAGTALDGSGATNQATVGKAALGLAVLGVYNGTTTLSADGTALSLTNAVFSANGLVHGETLSTVTLGNANVSGNGSNTVTSATGANGFNISNYQLGNSQNVTGGGAFDGTQTNPTTSTNAVWLRPAPLGVVVSGTYNGTTTFTTAGGSTITAYGLRGQDSALQLTSATLSSANAGAASTKVTAVSGPSPFLASNYVLDGSYLALSGSGTAGTALDGSGATNQATVGKAALGLAVLGVYNGTTTLSADGTALSLTNAVFSSNGLVHGETLSTVTLGNANVSGNGSNTVTSATGANGFNISNYQLGNSQNMSGSVAFDGTQTNPTTSTNAVWLRPAPLGVDLKAIYNGTSTYTNGQNGTEIKVSGLLGQDVNKAVNTASLNTRDSSLTAYVAAITSSQFQVGNYVILGAANSGTDGACVTGICSGGYSANGNVNGTNQVALKVLESPPPATAIPVPVFTDNGAKALVGEISPPTFGGMNYLQAKVVNEQLAQEVPKDGSPLTYVPVVARQTAQGEALQVPVARDPNRKPQSEMNVNQTSVPSNSSPLDVFVVDTGVNLNGVAQGVK